MKTTTATTTFDIVLAIKTSRGNQMSNLINSFVCGMDDENLVEGRDYTTGRIGGSKSWGYWVWTPANKEVFTKMMMARRNCGGCVMEQIECLDEKEIAEIALNIALIAST